MSSAYSVRAVRPGLSRWSARTFARRCTRVVFIEQKNGLPVATCRLIKSTAVSVVSSYGRFLREYPGGASCKCRRGQASAARNRPGVIPVARRKTCVRWLWSVNPASSAIEASGWRVRRIRVLARSIRRIHDVALRADTDRLLERPAEMVRAEASVVGEHDERKIVIEMRFDVTAQALQPFRRKALAGRQQEMSGKTPREANTQDCARAFDQDPVCKAAFDLLSQSRGDLAE
jgi:hypothetical protein